MRAVRLLVWLTSLASLPVAFLALVCTAWSATETFTFSDCLIGPPKTLRVDVVRFDRVSGLVECNGFDSAQPQEPFEWDWGDGSSSTGYFPQSHAYDNRKRNYRIRVTARYHDGKRDTAEVLVRFGPLTLSAQRPPLPDDVRVSVPLAVPELRAVRAPYGVSQNLSTFGESSFLTCTRQTVEYVLTQGAAIQMDLANSDVCRTGERFEQVLLCDSEFRGMYSLWYTDPVGIGLGGEPFGGEVQWSSFFHEMGHNVTLNSPADFHWGFRQDGPANTIYSETVAQVFQHATAYELVNQKQTYGVSDALALDIARSARSSMETVRRSYESYRENGCRFCSWNDAATEHDDTLDTFMTIAYTFFEHAEKGNTGYRQPVKRLMAFLQQFNPDWERRFSARENSSDAESFRATLMVAALSHAFESDLRTEFQLLRFPIDDTVFHELTGYGGDYE